MVEGTVLGAATDIEGNYFILQVPPGTYTVRFTMIGYQTVVMNDVRIRVDLTTTLDGKLSESAVGLEEVIVQAERPMIQTDVTYSQANISSEEVDMLPVEEFEDVLALQAGVVSTGVKYMFVAVEVEKYHTWLMALLLQIPIILEWQLKLKTMLFRSYNLLAEHLMLSMVRRCRVL